VTTARVIDLGRLADKSESTRRLHSHTHAEMERIRDDTLNNLRMFITGGRGPKAAAKGDVTIDIPYLERDTAAFRRKVLAGRLPRQPKARFISAEKARRQSRLMVNEIFAGYAALSAMVERHEALIQKRWMKNGQGAATKDSSHRLAWNDTQSPPRFRSWVSTPAVEHNASFSSIANGC
jgi:hypothetical protein